MKGSALGFFAFVPSKIVMGNVHLPLYKVLCFIGIHWLAYWLRRVKWLKQGALNSEND